MTILRNDPHFSHWTVVVLRSQLCRRWSDTKDETRRKWCRVFFLLLDDNDYERCADFMETARIHLIYQPRCRQCSIRSLWKILAKIGFHRQTPCHHVYNYIHIYISLLTRGKMVRRKANFSPSPPKVASIFEIFIERKSGEIGETSGVEWNRAVRLGEEFFWSTLLKNYMCSKYVIRISNDRNLMEIC